MDSSGRIHKILTHYLASQETSVQVITATDRGIFCVEDKNTYSYDCNCPVGRGIEHKYCEEIEQGSE